MKFCMTRWATSAEPTVPSKTLTTHYIVQRIETRKFTKQTYVRSKESHVKWFVWHFMNITTARKWMHPKWMRSMVIRCCCSVRIEPIHVSNVKFKMTKSQPTPAIHCCHNPWFRFEWNVLNVTIENWLILSLERHRCVYSQCHSNGCIKKPKC